MFKILTMLGTSIVVAIAMAIILMRFLRRLEKIEEERWGGRKDIEEGLFSALRRQLRKRKKTAPAK